MNCTGGEGLYREGNRSRRGGGLYREAIGAGGEGDCTERQ